MHRSQVCCQAGVETVQQLELSSQSPTDVLAATPAHNRVPACFLTGVTMNLLCARLMCLLGLPSRSVLIKATLCLWTSASSSYKSLMCVVHRPVSLLGN